MFILVNHKPMLQQQNCNILNLWAMQCLSSANTPCTFTFMLFYSAVCSARSYIPCLTYDPLVWHKINVSCVCGIVWWELPFAFFTFFSGSSCIHSVVSYTNSFIVMRIYKSTCFKTEKKKSFPKKSVKRHVLKNHYLMKINILYKVT